MLCNIGFVSVNVALQLPDLRFERLQILKAAALVIAHRLLSMALTKRQAHGDLPDPLRERPGIVSTVHSRPASLDTRARHALLDKHRGPRAHTLSCRMSRTFPRKQESPSTPHSLDRTSLACSSRLPLLGSGGPDALPPRPVFLIRPSLCVLPITRVWCFCQQRLGSLGALLCLVQLGYDKTLVVFRAHLVALQLRDLRCEVFQRLRVAAHRFEQQDALAQARFAHPHPP